MRIEACLEPPALGPPALGDMGMGTGKRVSTATEFQTQQDNLLKQMKINSNNADWPARIESALVGKTIVSFEAYETPAGFGNRIKEVRIELDGGQWLCISLEDGGYVSTFN